MFTRFLVPAIVALSACSLYDHGDDSTAHGRHGGGTQPDATVCNGPQCVVDGGVGVDATDCRGLDCWIDAGVCRGWECPDAGVIGVDAGSGCDVDAGGYVVDAAIRQ